MADVRREGLDEEQLEAAIGVISMFNYFTRVADATGIEFDYQTPLPAFEPDRSREVAPRPGRPASSGQDVAEDQGASGGQGAAGRLPQHPPLRAAWESWRAYELDSEEPLSRHERLLLASAAAEEAGDWDGAAALSAPGLGDGPGELRLIEFARKLSRQPWLMDAGDVEGLRAFGYSEVAILHVISVVAHQNADSRLKAGLAAASLQRPD